MPIYLTELIDRLPSDTAERVKKAKDKHNTRVRNALRHETGLKLNRGESESADASRTSVPIKVQAGLPVALERFTIPDEHRLAVLLSPWRDQLRQLRDSSKFILRDLLPTLSVHPRGFDLIKGRQPHLKPSSELAEDLLKEGDKYDLAKEMLAIEKDILGIYTHIGLDIDERSWKTESFDSSETAVVEGLAQHYTMLVSKRIMGQAPNALAAYRRLLECQPKPYRVQIPWEAEYTPEHMRLALISTRRHNEGVRLQDFETELKLAKGQLR